MAIFLLLNYSVFYDFDFIGHATSKDMVDHFTHAVLESGRHIPNMVQVSMDGPNVNWKFF